MLRSQKGVGAAVASALVVLLSLPGPALSDSMEGEDDWRFAASAMVGFHVIDTSDNLDNYGIVPSEGPLIGWRFQYRFHPRWGVEAGWMGSFSSASVKAGTDEADVDPMYLHANVVLHIPVGRKLDPFLTIGGGMAVLDVDRDGVGDSVNSAMFTYGGGAYYRIHRSFALLAEFRDFVQDIDGMSEDAATTLGLSEGFDEALNDVGIVIGGSFTW